MFALFFGLVSRLGQAWKELGFWESSDTRGEILEQGTDNGIR